MSEVKLIEDWRERWEPVTKDGKTIIAMVESNCGIEVWAYGRSGMFTYDVNDLIPKPRPKTYRPWKREEVPVDEWFRSKASGGINRILAVSAFGEIYIAGRWIAPETLLDDFVLNRTTESGEWLPVEQCPRCGVEE